MVGESLRPFRRFRDRIIFHLRFEDWPDDVPLPENTQVVEADGAFWPYWNLVFKPDKTVEQIAGWFIVPDLSIEETFEWYQTEMEKRGWVEEERADTLPTWALLRYHYPDTNAYVEISIRRSKHLNRTQPMIRWVAIHPYAPPTAEEAETASLALEEVVQG